MPAADHRSETILASARIAFAEKGFDGASMQDLARAAGMSVGNFYRYFASKAAIVEAIIARDMDEMEQDFAAIITSPDPMQSLRHTIRARIVDDLCVKDGKLWAEIAAAAQRKPEIGVAAQRMDAEIRGNLLTIFANAAGLTLVEAERRFRAHAALIVMMVKASGMQGPEPGEMRDQLTALLLRTIDRTLDEVTADAGAPPNLPL